MSTSLTHSKSHAKKFASCLDDDMDVPAGLRNILVGKSAEDTARALEGSSSAWGVLRLTHPRVLRNLPPSMRAFLHRCGSVPNPEAEKDGKEGEGDGSNGQHDADKDDDDDLFAPEGKAAATGFLQEGTEEEVMRQARESCLAAQALELLPPQKINTFFITKSFQHADAGLMNPRYAVLTPIHTAPKHAAISTAPCLGVYGGKNLLLPPPTQYGPNV